MGELLLGGLLERLQAEAVGAEQPQRLVDDAALACGVHALEHDQHPATSAGVGVGEHPLLEVRQLRPDVAQRLLRGALALLEAGRGGRVTVGERAGSRGQAEQVGDGVGHAAEYVAGRRPATRVRSTRGPASDAARPADAREVREGHPRPGEVRRRVVLRAEVGRVPVPRVQGRRRGGADLAQHQAAVALLPGGGRGDPGAAARPVRARRRAVRRGRAAARVRGAAGADPSRRVAHHDARGEDAGVVRRLRHARDR